MSLTPRENLLRAIHHENPEWIPLRSDEIMFCPRIIPDNIARAWVLEQKKYDGPVGGKDMFGIEWDYIPTVGGSMVRPGNPALADISDWKKVIQFPNIDAWDWEGSAKENEEYLNTDKYIVSWIFTGMFERLISFMDFEESLVALIDEDEQDDVKELFQALADFYKKYVTYLKKYYNIDAIFFHDDWGGQKASFFSVDTCREMIAPYLKQIVDKCHEIGVVFDFHCCGKIENLVPVMIECGMDKWAGQPINDKDMLIRKYGDKILIGSIDTVTPSPGTCEEMEKELEEKAKAYMDKYKDIVPEKLFYVNNFVSSETVQNVLHEAGKKLLGN